MTPPAAGSSAAAIVPAAGRGERLGPGRPKALRLLGGLPLLVHAVSALARARFVDVVVVAAPPDGIAEVRALLALHEVPAEVEVVAGGPTRQDSVRGALAALPEAVDVVLVHDAARPLAPSELADAVVAAVRAGADAVVPGLPVADTVKRVDADGLVLETVDRAWLRAVQTPQGFRRPVLAAAHAAAALGESGPADPRPATDDAQLVERLGHPVTVIAGAEEAFKVTRPLDLVLAETVLTRRRLAGAR
ncbi:MAG: 2-C-methyl-D-erythritol 4-phosphate cytidylyltransferase [Mycobacterium leprae]